MLLRSPLRSFAEAATGERLEVGSQACFKHSVATSTSAEAEAAD